MFTIGKKYVMVLELLFSIFHQWTFSLRLNQFNSPKKDTNT